MKLIIFGDPAGVTKPESYDLDPLLSVHENIVERLSSGADCYITINGRLIDPLTDPVMDCAPCVGDVVCVTRRPGYDLPFWVYALYLIVAIAAIASIPKPPKPSGGGEPGKDSPNNQLTGQTNIARVYQAVPDVYGKRRVWPDLIQQSLVEYIDNYKTITEWMCISRGKGTITGIKFADTPQSDIDGFSSEIFEPEGGGDYVENGSTIIPVLLVPYQNAEVNGQELPDLENGTPVASVADITYGASTVSFEAVDGAIWDELDTLGVGGYVLYRDSQELNYDFLFQITSVSRGGGFITVGLSGAHPASSWVTSGDIVVRPMGVQQAITGPFTTPKEADQLWFNFSFPRGLDTSVNIEFEHWRIDDDGVEVPATRQTTSITYAANTFDEQFRTHKISVAHGVYRVQIVKASWSSSASGAEVVKLDNFYGVQIVEGQNFPGCTLIKVRKRATLQATSGENKKYNLVWHRHVRTLSSSATSPSRNFARAIAHIWAISGNQMSRLDTAKLAIINGEFGEDNPLLSFDGSLDDADTSLGERLALIADHARCQVWRDGSKWTFVRDQARFWHEMQLDYRNLAGGSDSSLSYSSHMPASFDGVEVDYVDESEQKKKAYIRYNISTGTPVAGVAQNPFKVSLPGCTNTAQATNRALLEAWRIIYQRENLSITALSDAKQLGLGSLVRWVDPHDFAADDGLQAGEVIEIDGNIVKTSEALDWKGGTSGRMMLTNDQGVSIYGAITVAPTEGGAVLSTVPDGLYVADQERQLGSRYVFAVGLTLSEVHAAGLYLVTEATPEANGNVSLSLVNYDSRIYQDD